MRFWMVALECAIGCDGDRAIMYVYMGDDAAIKKKSVGSNAAVISCVYLHCPRFCSCFYPFIRSMAL